jgi:L-malate glycosyltransferase
LIQSNIIHIVRNPQIGGSEILVKNILNFTNTSEFNHSILYTVSGPLLSLIRLSEESNSIPCKFVNPLFFIYRLHKIIKHRKAVIIHTHQPIDALYALIASIGCKVKIIRTYHGYEGIYRRKPGFSYKSKLIYFFINHFVSQNLFVSEALMKYFRLINPDQSHYKQRILYNGVNIDDLMRDRTTNIRNELGLSKEHILLGMIGGFRTKGRDHFTVCKALKKVLCDHPELHFIFVGKTAGTDPELYNKCYNFCKKNNMVGNVHFIGERVDITGILNEMKLYVHSSNNETFGISLVEAMLISLPVLASDIPPFREVSDNGKCIKMFEKGNADDLYRKIINELRNIDSPETNERINKAKEFAEKNFSIKVHIQELHKIYRECLK